MKYKIISVESRKGGVGKTTAALNLSRLLIDKGYTVLLIDIDITGTNVVDALDSSYWQYKINPIFCKGRNANLLSIYQDVFMRGLRLPSWKIKMDEEKTIDSEISKKEKKVNFEIRKNHVNIIGSEIYNKVDKEKQSNLICNPSILFDELHAFWFVEYLQSICSSFAKKLDNSKVAIVLDNSPGYVGINPAIHDWLTDIGPTTGKFLTISSLDKQDLISCSRAIDNLHTLFQDKFKGATLYNDIIKKSPDKGFNLSGVAENFYLRIASKSLSDDACQSYNSQNISKNDFTQKPQNYQAIIINKVPIEIRDNSLSYNFSEIRDYTGNGETMNKLLGNNNNKNISHLVFYDEYINLQFIESSLSRGSNDNKRKSNLSILKRHFSRLENTIIKNRKETKYIDNLSISNRNYTIIDNNVQLYQRELDKLVDRFKRSSLSNIVRLITKGWHPEAPFETLRQYFNEFLIDYSHSNYDYEDELEKSGRMDVFFEEFVHRIEQRIYHQKNSNLFRDKSVFNPSFNTVLYLVISPFLGNEHIMEDLTDLITIILNIQLKRISELQSPNNKDFSIREFLINESISEDSLENKKSPLLYERSKLNIRKNESFVIDFYNSFCKAQIRLIDIDEDFDFLIETLRQISFDTENKKEILFPFIKDVLDNVIIRKSTPHSKARKEMLKGFVSANYMTEFQETLKKIISKWEIA